jgi:hypothetical protein
MRRHKEQGRSTPRTDRVRFSHQQLRLREQLAAGADWNAGSRELARRFDAARRLGRAA